MYGGKRLNNIDGWRAIACLGVLYGHVLGTLGNPGWVFWGINWLMVMNLWGYGVHLFFVISGLCFYLVLDKQQKITRQSIYNFWKRRWLRIAPAYYLSVFVYAGFMQNTGDINLFFKIVTNLLFIQPYIKGMEITAIFWSLSVEWFFYLILPFLFLFIKRIGLIPMVIIIVLSGLIFNGLHYAGYFVRNNPSWYYQFVANYTHFGWG
ncbi:MAG: acyltransferase family protein, partial [Bacteroidota bacterium]